MGQYYAYINSVKKEYFHPHDMGSGAKAIEEFYGICKIDDKIINNVPYNCGNDVILEIRTI